MNCKPCNKEDLKSDIFGPACCPVPSGEVFEDVDVLGNYTGDILDRVEGADMAEVASGCGEVDIDRIIGGQQVGEGEVPWMCAIMRYFSWSKYIQ